MLFPASHYSIVGRLPGSILLETSRFDRDNRESYLFVDPLRQLILEDLDGTPALFLEIEDALRKGFFVAGFMSYECGFHFEPVAQRYPLVRSSLPLAWFGIYERPIVFDHNAGRFDPELPAYVRKFVEVELDSAAFSLSNFRLAIDEEEYCANVERVRDYIAAGETYQTNFTSKLKFDFEGRPESCLAALRDQQHVSYGAFLNIGSHRILSLSPELFFRIRGGHVTMRPMKGTAPRGVNSEDDVRVRDWLHGDEKNRSENVMIVDLLRNDIGRVAEIGSVLVDNLFTVEKYETLFQMTSTITARLRPEIPFYAIFRAIFPCGSITGAPKVRTMQIIQELEKNARGIYTGAIGYFAPNRNAVFNVSIRTIVLAGTKGELGIGGGIVYDSVPRQECEESLLKGQFLREPEQKFQLLETLRWEGRYQMLDLHLDRMRMSAEYFGFPWDEKRVKLVLQHVQDQLQSDRAYKVRLVLDCAGAPFAESVPIVFTGSNGTVGISAVRISSQDRFLYHKTTRRKLYDDMYREARQNGYDDVIFLNERGEITEGSIHNIFIELSGKLFTPPIESGLLPGVLRRYILSRDGRASEMTLHLGDLRAADAIYLANSVRGMWRVKLIERDFGITRPPNPQPIAAGA